MKTSVASLALPVALPPPTRGWSARRRQQGCVHEAAWAADDREPLLHRLGTAGLFAVFCVLYLAAWCSVKLAAALYFCWCFGAALVAAVLGGPQALRAAQHRAKEAAR